MAAVLRLVLPAAVLSGSALLLWLGRARPARALALDAASLAVLLFAVVALAMGPLARDAIGILLVLALAVRVAPGAWLFAAGRAGALAAFAIALALYAPLSLWQVAASPAYGDQVHGLLAADGPAQGSALPLLLAPAYALAGPQGAALTMALIAALASSQLWLLLRGTVAHRRLAGMAWAAATFLPPLLPLALAAYPNALGALLISAGYRYLFLAGRPALGGLALGLTLLLTPRDGLLLLALLPFAFLLAPHAGSQAGRRVTQRAGLRAGPRVAPDAGRRARIRPTARAGLRALAGAALALLVTIAVNGLVSGNAFPYAGYLVGAQQAGALEAEPSLASRVWTGLPATLFDRTSGVAAVAPWLFLAILGLRRALQRAPLLLPAGAACLASLLALPALQHWEGSYAPPARSHVELVPLIAPFAAYGLAAASRWWPARAFAIVAVSLSALAALVLVAVPAAGPNGAVELTLRDALPSALGIDPLGWLPSFQPTAPDWAGQAALRLVPALLIVAALGWVGWRRPRPLRAPEPATWYAAACGALLALALAVVPRPAAADAVAEGAIDRWLPFALGGAWAVSAALATRLATPERAAYLRRSLLLIAAVPLAALLAASPFNGLIGAVYVALLAAFTLHALDGLHRALPRLSDRGVAITIAGVALAAYLILLPYDRTVMLTASDEPHYLIITQSLLYDRDLDLRNDYEGDRYRAFYPERLPDMHGIEVGRAVYPIRDLGLPLLSVVPFALAGRDGVLVLVCVAGALLAAQTWLLLRDLGLGRRIALGATAVASFTHPVLTYTTQVYPELISALVLVTIARLLRRGAGASLRELALASALIGTLPLLSTRSWLIAGGTGLVLAWCALRPLPWRVSLATVAKRAVAGAVPFAALVAAMAVGYGAMFGLFLPSAGYYIVRDQSNIIAYTPHIGALGLLFDRVFGLVGRAPIYLLAFVGLAGAWRLRGPALAVLAAGWLASFAFIASIAYWWADGSPPSRYLLATMPFLTVLVATGLEAARRIPLGPPLAWALAGASAFVAMVYAVMPNIRYDIAIDVRATSSSGQLWTFLSRVLRPDPGVVLPSLVRIDAASVLLSLAWIALAALLAYAGLRASRARAR